MSSADITAENASNKNEVSLKRMPCPLYGCKRAYADDKDLKIHVKDHELPTQSLPGKMMLCSTTGCGGSFPNMQKLMEHMRHHHKPNIYFLCEFCHAKLKAYRSLLVHLRTCSKAARPKANLAPSPISSSSAAVAPSVQMEVDPVKPTASTQEPLDSIPPPQLPPVPPLPAQPSTQTPKQDPTSRSLLNLNQDFPAANLLQHIIESTVSAAFGKSQTPLSPTAGAEVQTGSNSNQGPAQQQSPKPLETPGAPKLMPQTQPAKSGKGSTTEKRVHWQHTRGRYTCVQCGHTVTNRKDMTEHSAIHSDSPSPKKEPEQASLPQVRFS